MKEMIADPTMPLVGRKDFSSTCLVFDVPELPYPLFKGSIQYSDRMLGEPTATITYEAISSQEIGKLEAAYPMGLQISLYGVPMEVNNRSYDQTDVVVLNAGRLVVYRVTISLQLRSLALQAKEKFGRSRWQEKLEELGNEADRKGFLAYSDGLQVKTLGSGRAWNFTREQIIEVGGNAIALPSEGYNNAALTWGEQQANANSPRTVFSPAVPQVVTLVEGDPDPTIPPDNDVPLYLDEEAQASEAKKLRDSSSNYDESGPTKFTREVTTVDGTGESETYRLYGYAYQYIDIFDEDGYPRTDYDPADFWRLVEERFVTYSYRRLDAYSQLRVDIRDNSNLNAGGEGAALQFIIHPDYTQFLRGGSLDGSQSSVYVTSTTQYLLEVVTRGRKLVRLLQETDDRNTLDPTDAYVIAGLYEFEWTPFQERTAYLLKPARGTFIPDNEQLPFRVEFQDYDSLEPRLKQLADKESTTADGKVAILYPDPEYVEPFYISEEGTQANSYKWAPDPEGEVAENPTPGEPPKPPDHFDVGEESDRRIRRIPTDPANGFYDEITRQYSSQDPQFTAVAEQTQFKQMRGTPPTPTVRQIRFEPDTLDTSSGTGDNSRTYLVTTPDNSDRFPEGGSVNIPGASSLSEARQGVLTRLRRSGLQTAQAQYNVSWFYPDMKPGDSVTIEGDRHAADGTWLITQLSWTLTFDANNFLELGRPTVSCQEGMDLTLGLDGARSVRITSKPASANGGSPTVAGRITDGPDQTLGRILPPLPNRRNF